MNLNLALTYNLFIRSYERGETKADFVYEELDGRPVRRRGAETRTGIDNKAWRK